MNQARLCGDLGQGLSSWLGVMQKSRSEIKIRLPLTLLRNVALYPELYT